MSTETKSKVSKGENEVEVSDDGRIDWIGMLYEQKISDEDLASLYEIHRYHGFDRQEVLELLNDFSELHGKDITIEAILVCALKGPQRACSQPLRNGRSLVAMGVPKSVKPGSKGLSCGRITSATADLAAYFLKKLDVPKKISMDLPGWLQFPAAGSIRMPSAFREKHREFSEKFSELIRDKKTGEGGFNEQIYAQMEANSYYNESLRLF